MPRVDELGRRLRAAPDLRFEDIADDVLGEGFASIIAGPAMLGNGWRGRSWSAWSTTRRTRSS